MIPRKKKYLHDGTILKYSRIWMCISGFYNLILPQVGMHLEKQGKN